MVVLVVLVVVVEIVVKEVVEIVAKEVDRYLAMHCSSTPKRCWLRLRLRQARLTRCERLWQRRG